jgi:isopenicillin-N epimerase
MAGLQKRNHSLTLSARDALCQTLGVNPTCPDEMVGFTATLPLPDSPSHAKASGPFDPLQDLLYQRYRIEVPIMVWPHGTDAIRAHLGAGIQCNRPIYILGASA